MFDTNLRLKRMVSNIMSVFLAYVDDILVLSEKPEIIMKSLGEIYRLKDGFARPDRYLRAEIKEWRLPDDAGK